MNLNSITRVLPLVGFLIIMGISTWATVESLSYSLPNIPKLVLWPLSIIFFVVASWGVKLIKQGFDNSVRRNGRLYYIIGGVLLLMVFWLLLILTTNTHTFYYRNVIKQETLAELGTVGGVLKLIKRDGASVIKQEMADLETKVLTEITNFTNEILNPGNEGWGTRAENILVRIESLLGNDIRIQRLNLPSKRQSDLKLYSRKMNDIIREHLKNVLETKYAVRLANAQAKTADTEIESMITEVSKEEAYMKTNTMPRSSTKDVVIKSYVIINQYSDILKKLQPNSNFQPGNAKPEIIQLEDVYQVWMKFFSKKINTRAFIYWIILSAIIDIAGFILFPIAFKSNN